MVSEIIVAVCSLLGTAAGSFGGMRLMSYRIEQLEKRVNGCSGDVDLDKTAIDYPAKIKAAGKNGYKKPTDKNALDVKGFKRGDKGLGVYALKCRLMALGYKLSDDQGFGSGTEKAVNNLLKKWGYRENGIAGEKFLKIVMR
jgi:hypothetical protein